MTSETPNLTPAQAASVLSELRRDRDRLNNRAAGMLLMMWALVLTSVTGSLLLLDEVPHEDGSNVAWGLFLAANVAVVVAWVAVGAVFQGVILESFRIMPPAGASWRAPAKAAAVTFLLVPMNLVLQGIVRSIQDVSSETATMAELHHNLGFAFALGIGGAVVVAIFVLLGSYGFPKRRGILTGIAMMVGGHSTAFLWVPDLGVTGPAVAVAVVPVVLLVLGYRVWRRG